MRELLRETAEHGTVMIPVEQLVRRARRRRRRLQSLTVGGAAALVAAAVLVPAALRGAPVPPPAPAPRIPMAGVTAARLAHYRWSQIPAAPIVGRLDPAAVWDGRQMLVWGGDNVTGERQYGDGAAYDPATRTWTKLPAAPLAARSLAAYAWTGHYLFVWGGQGSHGFLGDGALYDPAARAWRTLPPAPLTAGLGQAVLVGNQVLVLNGASSATYDPASNAWHALPALPLASGWHPVVGSLVGAGSAAYLFEQVTRGFYSGLEAFKLESGAWQRVTTTGNGPPYSVGQPLWTGSDLLVPAVQQCPANASCPFMPRGEHGYRLDVASGHWTSVSEGPMDGTNPTSVWTGAALLDVDPLMGGVSAAAAWDPISGRWIRLAPTRHVNSALTIVWTGDRLIEWGLVGLQFAQP